MTPVDHAGRWAWAEIDLGALRHNVATVRRAVAPSEVWAVVKADGYGHGAVAVALSALEAGATGLCVALVSEGVELRGADIVAPILVFGEQPVDQLDEMLEHGLTPTAYSDAFVAALATRREASVAPLDVHVNVDTGMQRVGVPAAHALGLVESIAATPVLRLAGLYTHLACADEPEHEANEAQLSRFEEVLGDVAAAGIRPSAVHVANSAAALALPSTRRSLVRLGIAMYGISPGPGVDHLCSELEPVLGLRARVSQVKRVDAGSHVSYGWRHRFDRATNVVTVPLGYADGVPRRLGTLSDRPGADVLIGGRRCPIVGVVTMDQFMVDVGDMTVDVGDEVVLIGAQGADRIRAEHWAERLGTIGYEIVCGISARIPRLVRGDPPAP